MPAGNTPRAASAMPAVANSRFELRETGVLVGIGHGPVVGQQERRGQQNRDEAKGAHGRWA